MVAFILLLSLIGIIALITDLRKNKNNKFFLKKFINKKSYGGDL